MELEESEAHQRLALETPFFRAYGLEKVFGFGRIFIKYEGGNPTGTQKDRAAVLHAKRAAENGFDTITVGTCGNYGTSIAYYASLSGLRSVIFVPKGYLLIREREMRDYGAEIVRVDGKYEEAVKLSSIMASRNGWYDANPGGKSRRISLMGYARIAHEIYRELGRAPTTVSVPVGNGTTLAGIYHGFLLLRKKGLIERVPRMIGASTVHGNPVVRSFKMGFRRMVPLSPDRIVETDVNEPLVAYYSYEGDEALNAIRRSGGYAGFVSDEKMIYYANLLRNLEGISVLPASASAIDALRQFVLRRRVRGDHVVVITGRSII
jgi:threonine synthase